MTLNRFERLGERMGQIITQRPKTALALISAVCLLGLSGLLGARFSTDYRIFFSKEDPGLVNFQHLESVFTKTDNVLFVVRPADGDVFGPDALAALEELTTEGWKLPYASRVDSLVNFPFAEGNVDELSVHPLVDRDVASLSQADRELVRSRAADEPILVGSLLSRDLRTAGVNVTLRLPRRVPEEVPEATGAAQALVDQVKAKHPSLEVRATGMAFVNDAFMKTAIQDMAVMMPLMLLMMLTAMALLMRSAWATGAVASVIAMSAGLAMASAGWFSYPLSAVSVAAPMIVLTVAIADGVHVVTAMMEHRRAGMTKDMAIIASLRGNLEAVTYTWLTTVVGFLCLNSSDAPPVLHLANMASVGVTAAYLLSVTLLPALLMVLPIRVTAATEEKHSAIFGRLGEWVMHRRRFVLAASVLFTFGAGYTATRLEPNDAFLGYFDAKLPFRQDIDFAMKHLSGAYRLEFQLGAGEAQGVTDPAYLQRVEAFSEWLGKQPEVRHVMGLNDVIKRVHQVATVAPVRALPATREEASEALLLYSMQLPVGLELTDRVTVDQSASRLTVTVNDMSTREMTAFATRAERWLHSNTPPSMWTTAAGPVVIFSALSARNARGMIQGDLWSLVLISLCMILVLRSLRLGLISVIPNLIPIVVGYGIWWFVVGELNVVGTIAGSISLGIIVDDTIHFLTKYRTELALQPLRPELAMRRTLEHVGPAMVSTSVVLVLGFGVLTLSNFQMTSHLGWLSVLIVGVAPLADLIVAPALVLTFVGAPTRDTTSLPLPLPLPLSNKGVTT